jgi:phospholipase C
MNPHHSLNAPNGTLKCGAAMLAVLLVLGTFPQSANAEIKSPKSTPKTKTPIEHVVIIIGENRTFDHVFGTYVPKVSPRDSSQQQVWNLYSQGIVNLDGTPVTGSTTAQQYSATDSTTFQINPGSKLLYVQGGKTNPFPPVLAGGYEHQYEWQAPFTSEAVGKLIDPDLARDYNRFLTTGATGIKSGKTDTRITSVNPNTPPNGPYQITGTKMPYDAYTASPVHRLFQMWQQTDCSAANAKASSVGDPCLKDLFPWVEVTMGTGSYAEPQPPGFNDRSTGEGAASMGFYNINEGDVPYFKYLADNYTINDNFHQSVMGGTGANHIMFGFGDAIYYENSSFKAATPPPYDIEDLDPQPGTNNWPYNDGYGNGGTYNSSGVFVPPSGGGSYVACADTSEGGVPAIVNYLDSMGVKPNCGKTGSQYHYYLVNNYNPGYFPSGDAAPITDTANPLVDSFTIPPTSQKSIADAMNAAGLTITYFGEQWDLNAEDPGFLDPTDQYCNICNPFEYESNIMANPLTRLANNADEVEFLADIDAGSLPDVSIVKPSGNNDGHPASSKLDLFEGFCKRIIDGIQANPSLWATTAIFITEDEGGGYYDSGYIQPIDFFGDGTRIPLIVVSPYSTGGYISHDYADHVSLDKFIEYNWQEWKVGTISDRSRDNLPNPKQSDTGTTADYVPSNGPALSNLVPDFDLNSPPVLAVPPFRGARK